ncbi:PIN domain-containing protein [Candidatus Woesearchaeota archaeon]|nr:PIN domain-containing protein [Candidatus Woesearchaeota archaeon]
MIVVVDVNPLISALIRDSYTRRIFAGADFDFCLPEPALQKIRKYKQYIIDKSGLSELEYLAILHSLLRFIRIIPVEDLQQHFKEAKKIMEHIDPEDAAFIAAALSQENAVIWSDDAHFDKQNKVKVLKTKNMAELCTEKTPG